MIMKGSREHVRSHRAAWGRGCLASPPPTMLVPSIQQVRCAMIVKRVMKQSGWGGPWRQLAAFHMEGDAVVGTYDAEGYKNALLRNGIIRVVDGEDRVLFPSDGKLFFDALDIVYSQSSFM